MLFVMCQLSTPGLPPHADWLADPYTSAVNARKGLQFIFLAVLHDQQFVENWLCVFPGVSLSVLREELAGVYQVNEVYATAP